LLFEEVGRNSRIYTTRESDKDFFTCHILSDYEIPSIRYIEQQKNNSLPSLEHSLFTNKKRKKEEKRNPETNHDIHERNSIKYTNWSNRCRKSKYPKDIENI